jgi:hypothetical protein
MPPKKESEPGRETEPNNPYVKAARYNADAAAYAAYSQAQEILFSADCDLSAYRIRYKDVPHVVVLGSSPSTEVDEKITGILARGEPPHCRPI